MSLEIKTSQEMDKAIEELYNYTTKIMNYSPASSTVLLVNTLAKIILDNNPERPCFSGFGIAASHLSYRLVEEQRRKE